MRVKFKGVSIAVSYPFTALLTLSLVFDKTGIAFCCFLSALLHELGHIGSIMYLGGKGLDISLSLFDFKIKDRDYSTRTNIQSLIISACGPITNFILFTLLFPISATSNFAVANLVIGIFNSIPIESLDGGNILKIILMYFLSPTFCDKIIFIISIIFILLLFTIGFYILILTGYNFTLLLIALYLSALLLFKPNHNI